MAIPALSKQTHKTATSERFLAMACSGPSLDSLGLLLRAQKQRQENMSKRAIMQVLQAKC